MTIDEAKKERIRILKIDIKRRLHKRNPDKYPYPIETYSASEVLTCTMTLAFNNITIEKLFNREIGFFKF